MIEDRRAVPLFTVHEAADEWHREIEQKVLSEACESDADGQAGFGLAGLLLSEEVCAARCCRPLLSARFIHSIRMFRFSYLPNCV